MMKLVNNALVVHLTDMNQPLEFASLIVGFLRIYVVYEICKSSIILRLECK